MNNSPEKDQFKLTVNGKYLTTDMIANSLNSILEKRGITAQFFINKGENAQQVYSVLKIGKAAGRMYKITTLLKIMNILEIDFSDLKTK